MNYELWIMNYLSTTDDKSDDNFLSDFFKKKVINLCPYRLEKGNLEKAALKVKNS